MTIVGTPNGASAPCAAPRDHRRDAQRGVSALRDWAHREGYRTLRLLAHDDDRPALGPDAEADGFMQETCALALV